MVDSICIKDDTGNFAAGSNRISSDGQERYKQYSFSSIVTIVSQGWKNDRRTDPCGLRRNPVAAPLPVQLRERTALEAISQLHNPGNLFVWRPAVQGFGEDHTGRAATRD
jgi:hypothetical protein